MNYYTRRAKIVAICGAWIATNIRDSAQFCATEQPRGAANGLIRLDKPRPPELTSPDTLVFISVYDAGRSGVVRKLIAFDVDTLDVDTLHKLTQLGLDRMATIQELADEAFADMLKKHGIPIDLKDALRKSAARPTDNAATKTKTQNRLKSLPAPSRRTRK